MALTKNLANCSPREFLIQTNRIRKSAEKWLTATDVMNIRKNVPKLNIPEGATKEEADEIRAKFKEDLNAAARRNISEMMDSAFEKHTDETLELLALLCFVEPKDVNTHRVTEYLSNITEIINDKEVLDFFTSLMPLVNRNTLTA